MRAMSLITPTAYAKQKGVTKQAVHRAIKDGRITFKMKNGRKMIDPRVADQEWKRNTGHSDELNQSNDRTSLQPSYAAHRAIEKAYKARLAKLEYEERTGKLVSAEKVKIDGFNFARILRDNILNVPDRISTELAAETDPAIVHSKLMDELIRALGEVVGSTGEE